MGASTYMGNTQVTFQRRADATMETGIIWVRVHQQQTPVPAGNRQGVLQSRFSFFVNTSELTGAYPDGTDVGPDDVIAGDKLPEAVMISSMQPSFQNDEETEIVAEFNY